MTTNAERKRFGKGMLKFLAPVEAQRAKAKKGKARKATNDPASLRRALKWYLAPGKDRTIRQTVKKYRSISFEALRKAALRGASQARRNP